MTPGNPFGILAVDPGSGAAHELWRSDDTWPAYPVASDDGTLLGVSGHRFDTGHWLVEGL
jgi:hypothetical protein